MQYDWTFIHYMVIYRYENLDKEKKVVHFALDKDIKLMIW